MKNFFKQLILVVFCGLLVAGVVVATVFIVPQGGTGISSVATGDILYADGTNSLTVLNAGSDTEVLTLAGGVPTWAAGGAGSGQGYWCCQGFSD